VLLSFIILVYPKLCKRERNDQEGKNTKFEESDEDSTEISELYNLKTTETTNGNSSFILIMCTLL